MARLLVIIGSGETGPAMARLHQDVLRRLDDQAGPVVVIDTPYAFQENAAELDGKLGEYFSHNVGAEAEVAAVRSPAESDAAAAATAVDRARAARLVFAGPGSPSYALRHWRASGLPGALARKLATGGAVSFASAAAATLGRWALPVYEIYKAGADPHWLDGLDLMAVAGLSAVVVPHWNNAEGGTHDTSRCYVGDRRLRMLMDELPAGTVVFGVDEHTAAIVDLDGDAVEAYGKGVVTFRRGGDDLTVEAGERLDLDRIRKLADTAPEPPEPEAYEDRASVAVDRVEEALAAGEPGEVAALALDLAADGGEELTAVIARLAGAAGEARADPLAAALPHVEAVLAARNAARVAGEWAQADGIRDFLTGLGIEVHDTPDGTTWERVDGD